MPKKTKEQKMASQLRRLKRQAQPKKRSVETETKRTQIKPAALPPTNYGLDDVKMGSSSYKKPLQTETQRYDYSHVNSDIKKIVVLSIIAVTFEVVLSLTMRNEFATLLLLRFGIEI